MKLNNHTFVWIFCLYLHISPVNHCTIKVPNVFPFINCECFNTRNSYFPTISLLGLWGQPQTGPPAHHRALCQHFRGSVPATIVLSLHSGLNQEPSTPLSSLLPTEIPTPHFYTNQHCRAIYTTLAKSGSLNDFFVK